MITYVFRLQRRIEKFYSTKYNKGVFFSMVDTQLESDWHKLKIFKNLSHFFYHLAIYLQENSKNNSH